MTREEVAKVDGTSSPATGGRGRLLSLRERRRSRSASPAMTTTPSWAPRAAHCRRWAGELPRVNSQTGERWH